MPFQQKLIAKKIIDSMVNFLRVQSRTSRLYQHTQITDRFSLEAAKIPSIIIRSTSNTQRRIDTTDFITDYQGRVKFIPIKADDDLVGNNLERVNLPQTLDYDPRWAFDPTIGYPTGTDITNAVFTNSTGSNFGSGVTTGAIITLPPPNTFEPSSINWGLETYRLDGTANPIDPINGTGTHTIAVALSADQEQFYLVYSGDSISGTVVQPVDPDQFIVNASGLVPGLSGTAIKLSDVLWAGDQYRIETYDTDQLVYGIYGGIYDISISFECYATSTIEAQELGDLVESFLVEKKKNPYDLAGINLINWSQNSGGELEYLTGHIFQSSVTVDLFVFWQEYRPVEIITSASGTAISSGIYSLTGAYVAPSVYTNNNS